MHTLPIHSKAELDDSRAAAYRLYISKRCGISQTRVGISEVVAIESTEEFCTKLNPDTIFELESFKNPEIFIRISKSAQFRIQTLPISQIVSLGIKSDISLENVRLVRTEDRSGRLRQIIDVLNPCVRIPCFVESGFRIPDRTGEAT